MRPMSGGSGRPQGAVWLVVLAASLLTGGVPRKAAQLNRDGNRAFDNKKFDDAAQLYEEAQTKFPESPELAYNKGDALYKLGKYGDAVGHLRRGADSTDPAMRQKSLYNLGNAFHELKELQMAAKAYRDALKLNPADLDAKINYEKTMRELKENPNQQKQDQKQNQNQKKDDQNGQGQNQQDKQDQNGQNQQGQNPKDPQQQQQDKQDDQGKEGQQPQQQDENGDQKMAAQDSVPVDGLTREEALRILEAMRQQERELQKQKAQQVKTKSRRVDKDW